MELVALIGLQGSGKTTFYFSRFASTHEHISKDLMGRKGGKEARQQALLRRALLEGRSVVVDNTNPSRESRRALLDIARAFGARAVAYYFPPDLQGSLRRNRLRSGCARVPDVAIRATARRLEPPIPSEGWTEIHEVRISAMGGFQVESTDYARL